MVLAHELAHVYTHLGGDIDDEGWETECFAASDLVIVEGLAQFYTEAVCSRLHQRMPTALDAYNALLAIQSHPYRAYRDWLGDDERAGEIIRVSMIECRSKRITSSNEFCDAIDRYRQSIRRR
ncbi:MAG: hypothetical protein IH908_14705 [Proteobacteria bacterium]|nr:hypothetical protein [Pseudomonadota bacterium]